MDPRRRSKADVLEHVNSISSITQLNVDWSSEDEKAKSTRYLSHILRNNLHRFGIALFMLAIGVPIVVIVLLYDSPDHELRNYYDLRHLISIPMASLVMVGLWLKVYLTVRHTKIAITEYHTSFAADPAVTFVGVKVTLFRRRIVMLGMVIVLIMKFVFMVIMSIALKKACVRLNEGKMPPTDTVLVVLFSLALVGGILCFITSCHAVYTILLFFRPQSLRVFSRSYPLLIYSDPNDAKPVLLK